MQTGITVAQLNQMRVDTLNGTQVRNLLYEAKLSNKPVSIIVEYGILVNNSLTVKELNKMLVGELNGIQVKSLAYSDPSFEIIPLGVYNVDDYTDNDDGTITIKALDNMIKFESDYDGSKLINEKGYATLYEVVKDICDKTGVEVRFYFFFKFGKTSSSI